MASESVTTTAAPAPVERGSKHDLWLPGGDVLTVTIDKQCMEFPPDVRQCGPLNDTIQGLARAVKAVLFHAENDSSVDMSFAAQPIENIIDAIILLSQLSEAVRSEVGEAQA